MSEKDKKNIAPKQTNITTVTGFNAIVTENEEPDASVKVEEEPEHKTSKQRRLNYLLNGIDSDCEVHVQCDCTEADLESGNVCYKKFLCHRLFLATASEKLEMDIYQNKRWNGVLQINGVSPEAVQIFLEFIYTFEINSSNVELEQIGDIFILACAYNMPELLCTFATQLKTKEWPLNRIFSAFDLAFRHNILELEHICLGKILEHGKELSKEPNLMQLQIYALNYVIQHWLASDVLTREEMIEVLIQYQRENKINFSNAEAYPHFTKIIKFFPNVLLDSDGYIAKF